MIPTTSSGEEIEGVGRETTEGCEVPEVDGPLNEQDCIDDEDERQEDNKGDVIEEILFAEELGNLLTEFLYKFLLWGRFGWYEPLPCEYDFNV